MAKELELCISMSGGWTKENDDTYFLRLGEFQVVHDVHKLVQALGQARVELALLTHRRHRLTWYTKTDTGQYFICGNCGLYVYRMLNLTDQSK